MLVLIGFRWFCFPSRKGASREEPSAEESIAEGTNDAHPPPPQSPKRIQKNTTRHSDGPLCQHCFVTGERCNFENRGRRGCCPDFVAALGPPGGLPAAPALPVPVPVLPPVPLSVRFAQLTDQVAVLEAGNRNLFAALRFLYSILNPEQQTRFRELGLQLHPQ